MLKKNNGRERKYHHQNEAKNWSETRSRHRWRWICRVALVRCLGRCAWLLFFFFVFALLPPRSNATMNENNKFPRRALTTFFHFFRALKQRGDYVICMGTRLVHRFGSIVAPSVWIFRARARVFCFFFFSKEEEDETRLDAGLHVKSAHKKSWLREREISFFPSSSSYSSFCRQTIVVVVVVIATTDSFCTTLFSEAN